MPIKLKCNKYHTCPGQIYLGTSGSYGVESLELEFNEDWEGLTKKVSFYPADDSEGVVVVLTEDYCTVPAELTAVAGVGKIVVEGFADDKRILSSTILAIIEETEDGASNEPVAPTPTEAEQALLIAQEAKEIAEKAGDASEDQITNVVDKYLAENPIEGGMTEEQAEQLNENTDAIAELQNGKADRSEIPTTLPASDVYDWAKQENKPGYTAEEVGADPAGTAKSSANTAVAVHNADTKTHNDIRLLITQLTTRLNTIADSEDVDLDQLSELVAYIKSNRELIAEVTTNKVNVSDIVNDLVTNVSNKPLSAAQGVALKALIDTLQSDKLDTSKLTEAINTALTQAKESGEFDGEDGDSGVYIGKPEDAPDDATVVIDPEGDADSTDGIPLYWNGEFTDSDGNTYTNYLDEKIAAIKALQDKGGKDCFSFIVMTDIHYESNLGKRSPAIAKRIMDECGIKYCLCLGDMQTRHGAKYDEAYIENEWKNIEEMISPIRANLIITQGNHDGSYGWFDLNGDGLINDDVNGDGVINSYDKDVHNYMPQKLYERIFRKVSTIDNVHFSADGKGYYVDDFGSKVRYIILNSHTNKYELNDDGTIKYNNMYNFRFGQAQYDMVIEALTTIPTDSWSVVCASHVPLDRSGEYVAWGGEVDENDAQTGNPADCVIMMRLLNAYVNKSTYGGSFVGNQGGGAGYINLANTASTDWATDSRITSSGSIEGGATGRNVTNYIPYTEGDIIKLKGLTLYTSDRFAIYDLSKTQKYLGTGSGLSSCITTEDGVTYLDTSKLKNINGSAAGGSFIRLPVQLVDDEEIIITTGDLNASSESFDTVEVSADFTNAKGTLISYHGGHVHKDGAWGTAYAWNGAEHSDFYVIATRCDAAEENDSTLLSDRAEGTITEQSFDVFTVNKSDKKIYATKIGAGVDREISY